jgi:hypothetical protein
MDTSGSDDTKKIPFTKREIRNQYVEFITL